jgi:heat shock protein HslJ
MGGYSLSGEGFSIDRIGSTMMAYPEPQMAFEQRFLALLEAVARFDITPEGDLVLLTQDGQEIRARRRSEDLR